MTVPRRWIMEILTGRDRIEGLPVGYAMGNVGFDHSLDAFQFQIFHDSFPEVAAGIKTDELAFEIVAARPFISLDPASDKGPTFVYRRADRPASERALQVAARVWCDQEMSALVMDAAACKRIAVIVDEVLQGNSEQVSPLFTPNDKAALDRMEQKFWDGADVTRKPAFTREQYVLENKMCDGSMHFQPEGADHCYCGALSLLAIMDGATLVDNSAANHVSRSAENLQADLVHFLQSSNKSACGAEGGCVTGHKEAVTCKKCLDPEKWARVINSSIAALAKKQAEELEGKRAAAAVMRAHVKEQAEFSTGVIRQRIEGGGCANGIHVHKAGKSFCECGKFTGLPTQDCDDVFRGSNGELLNRRPVTRVRIAGIFTEADWPIRLPAAIKPVIEDLQKTGNSFVQDDQVVSIQITGKEARELIEAYDQATQKPDVALPGCD